jgi:hypothetical protein
VVYVSVLAFDHLILQTDQSWLSSSAYSQVPVRAEIFGMQLQDGAPSWKFHHIYDYTDFATNIDPLSTVFEVRFVKLSEFIKI